jgi:hypothetical protein
MAAGPGRAAQGRRPHSARTASSGPPPLPAAADLTDAVFRGLSAASGRMQRERAANLLLAPGMPPSSRPRKMLMTAATDAHHLPSPSIGARNAKALAVGRLSAPPSSDPELLQKLLRFVQHGLNEVEPASHGYQEERLDVFRRAFGHFTAAFGAYAPLLLAVQEAYEDAIAHAEARAAGVDEAAERLALMQEETSQLMAHLKQDASAAHDGMAQMVAERDERLRAASRENEKLKAEVRKLSNEMVHAQRLRDELEMRNVELSKQVEHWQAETADARRQAGSEDNELERMRREVKALTDREINFLLEDREQRQLFRDTKQELEELKQTSVPKELHKNLTDQLARAHLGLKAAKAECDELRRILAGGESHSAFPNGLEWAHDDLDGISYLDPGWRGRQVHGIIADLVLDILTLHHLSGHQYAPSHTLGLATNGRRGPLFTLDAIDGASATESRAVVLLQGESSFLREHEEKGGSSFDGFIRLRPFLWPLEDVRSCVRKLWTEYKRRVLTLQGARSRGGGRPGGGSSLMLPETTVQILHELMIAWLASWKRDGEEGADGGSAAGGGGGAAGGGAAAAAVAAGGAAAAGAASKKAKREAVHKGLLCADTYNLQASMWRLRDEEPQAALFCQVCIGQLPPGVFFELHKVGSALYRSLSTQAVKDKVALETLRPRLQAALPGASEAQREVLVQKLLVDAGVSSPSPEASVRLSALEPAPKEPCEGGKLTTPVQCEVQKLFLILNMTLRADLEQAIIRAAIHRLASTRGEGTVLRPGVLTLTRAALSHALGREPLSSLDLTELTIGARDCRAAMLRVDSQLPEPTVADHLMRAFDGIPGGGARAVRATSPAGRDGGGGAAAGAAAGGEGGAAAAGAGAGAAAGTAEAAAGAPPGAAGAGAAASGPDGGGGDAGVEEPIVPVDEVFDRLFAEPMRRFSPRADPALRDKLVAMVKAGGGGGKKGKGGGGKKAKGGDGPPTLTYGQLRDCLLKADPKRPEVEADCLAAHCIAQARKAAAGSSGAATAAGGGGSPPGSPRGGGWEAIGDAEDPMATAAPLDKLVEVLESDALIQCAQTLHHPPHPSPASALSRRRLPLHTRTRYTHPALTEWSLTLHARFSRLAVISPVHRPTTDRHLVL